ncbi:serine hydrolase domain-containing protein [Luteimonas sp. SDU101]|uniref:serine hydrolase domain-containing protein n=1 Tax=unclassified Luteimonas TaxID=2629088 RepID=UPI003EB79522
MSPRIRNRRALAVCASLLLFLAQLAPALASGIEDRLQALMDEYDTVGLAVVVVRDNAVVYRNSLGWKDREARIPLGQDDLFRIASISKSFSTTAVLQLVEQGRLSLDADVGELIGFPVRNPAFPERVITLKMLLDHTSSITDGQRYGSLDIINPATNPTWQAVYAERAPGERYEYSNLGYNMVGTIIERVSGQRFDQYIAAHVLQPLGLQAGYAPDLLDASRFAQIYRWRDGEGFVHSPQAYAPLAARLADYTMGYSAPIFSPTGGLKISAPDLATWMLLHMNLGQWNGVRLISQDHAQAMQAPSVAVDDHSDYGLAIRIDRTLIPGVEMVGHTGSAHGLFSSMFFDRARSFGLVVITNGTRSVDVRNEVNRALYQHFIAPAATQAADAG